MKLNCLTYAVEIIPENDVEKVYLESVLGFTKDVMEATATRKTIIGMSHTLTYVEIKKAGI